MENSTAQSTLTALLSEEVASAQDRAASEFDRQLGQADRPIVLFGSGQMGRRTLEGMRKKGLEPVAIADNNQALWGTDVIGVPVISPDDAAVRYGATAAFLVAIWHPCPKSLFLEIRDQLRRLGCPLVLPACVLFWKFPDLFLPFYCLDLPQKVCAARADIRQAFEYLADEDSRAEYVAQVRWRLWLDFEGLRPASSETEYFPGDLLRWSQHEVFIDCGAFTGDTLEPPLEKYGGGVARTIALEPDPANYAKLQEHIRGMPEPGRSRTVAYRYAVGARREKVRFDFQGNVSSHMGVGSDVVESMPLDEVLAHEHPSYIKMDIEGAELDALTGAAQTIRTHCPGMAICVYHQQDHLWRVPLLIRSFSDDYAFFLRSHGSDGIDLLYYAVPRERLLK